ncbi:MAG: TadE/TadG family type IV pilus assembly protein [Verrucomicrobiota bacterium]
MNIKKYNRGQAFAELSLIMAVLLVLVFGGLEFAKMISMSNRLTAVAREAGRMINAQEYDSDQITNVFGVATNMIAPGDLANQGRMIVSFVERVSGARTDIFVSPPTDTNRDYLIITDRFYYPYSGTDPRTPASNNMTNWMTHLPQAFDNGMTNVDDRLYIPFSNNVGPVTLEMLLSTGKTAVVEVFYSNNVTAPLTNLGINVPTYLYTTASF